MIEPFIFGSGPVSRGLKDDSLNRMQQKNLFMLRDFMETILDTEFIDEESRGWREYNRNDIQSRLKLAGVDLKNLASNIVSLHCEFEKLWTILLAF